MRRLKRYNDKMRHLQPTTTANKYLMAVLAKLTGTI